MAVVGSCLIESPSCPYPVGLRIGCLEGAVIGDEILYIKSHTCRTPEARGDRGFVIGYLVYVIQP